MNNLVDELAQKQANKFQLNKFDKEFIDNTLSENQEGIFNLLYKMRATTRQEIFNYINENHPDYKTGDEVIFTGANYEIPFKKKEKN